MTFRRFISYIVILILVVIIGYAVVHKTPGSDTSQTNTNPIISTAHYSCDNGASIDASFTASSVSIALSDNRRFDLPQAISASGTQYTQGSVSFITKGDNAFLQENNVTTFNNCLTGTTTEGSNGFKTFTDQGNTFSFQYPEAFSVTGGGIGYSESWKNAADGTLGLTLANVMVPQNYEPNTNFGDAKFTVGTSSDPKAVKACLADTTGDGAVKSTTTINGVTYTVFTSTDAGAGNRYETTSYRTVQNDQCYAIEYTIHYAVLENFDPKLGVTAFDEQKIKNALEAMVQSFNFIPQD